MSKYIYKFNTGAVIPRDVWEEASPDELRLLTFIMTGEGGYATDEIEKACHLSSARTKSALALWRESGIVTRMDAAGESRNSPRVTLEFGESAVRLGTDEMTSCEVARSIRDHDLKELCDDVALMMSKPMLNQMECMQIASLIEQYSVSKEYLLMLAANLLEDCEKKSKRFTTRLLANRVTTLIEKGIDTVEALEIYVDRVMKESAAFGEYRRTLGIWDRALTKSERSSFETWMNDYGYGTEIIGAAYDITISNTNKYNLKYLNTILAAWHEAGVKTLGDVDDYLEKHKSETAVTAPQKAKKKSGKATAETPLYSEFNSEDALMRALTRSYEDD